MLRVPSCYWHVKANFCVVLYFVKTDGRINGVSFQKLATCFCLLHGDKPYPTYTVQRCSWCDTQVQYVALLTHFSVSAVQIKWGNSCSGIKAQLTLSDNTTIGGRRRHWCCDFFLDFGQTYTTIQDERKSQPWSRSTSWWRDFSFYVWVCWRRTPR